MKYIFLTLLLFMTSLYGSKDVTANNAVVFMYHHFGKSQYPSTNIRLEQFEKHLDYLEKNNYNVLSLSEILRDLENKRTLPPKTVAITIDDAYKSVYTKAYPMLKERNFPFTVFVNTSAIGRNSVVYITWEDMREMKSYGGEFLNHSSTHDYLKPKKNERKQEWQKRIKKELEDAQRVLQGELGSTTNENPKLLAYPFGEYTQETADFIRSLGYIGVTQTSGVLDHNSDLRRIPRYAMSEAFGDIKDFIFKAKAAALDVRRVEPWGPVVATNPPSLQVTLKEAMKNVACYTSSGKKIKIQWNSKVEFEAKAPSPLRGERDRYTCTAQDSQGKWYWYSHLWILEND